MAFESNITDVTIWNPDGSKGSMPHPIGCKGNNLEVLFDTNNRFVRPGYGEFSPLTQSLQQFFIKLPCNYIAQKCSDTGSTQIKTITIDSIYHFELNPGATIAVLFDDTNSADNPQLNVNTLGAKSIRKGAMVPPNVSGDAGILAGHVSFFQYDGEYWNWISYGEMPQVQSDWIEQDSAQPSFILNKPTLGNISSINKDDSTSHYLRGDGQWVTPPNDDTNTTYTFTSGTNKFTVTPSTGNSYNVNVTPSIANNITGSGNNNYIAKFNGTNTITNGPAFGSDTTKYLRNDGSWVKPPNDNTTYSIATGDNNGQIKVTPSSGSAYNVSVKGLSNLAYKGVSGSTAQYLRGDGNWTNFPTSLPASDVYAWAKASSKPNYSWNEIQNKPSTFTPSAHTHDDRYYTETEINNKFNTLGDAAYKNTSVTAAAGKVLCCDIGTGFLGSITLTGGLSFYKANVGAAGLSLSDNGTLKIQSASAWLNLQSTNIQCRSNDDQTWSVCAAAAFNIKENSTRKVKENIQPLTNLEASKLLNINVVSFDYKKSITYFGDGDERKGKFGVIAEEVNEIIPFVVNYNDEDGSPSGVNYERFVPHLIKLAQMQQQEINELKEEINELKGGK